MFDRVTQISQNLGVKKKFLGTPPRMCPLPPLMTMELSLTLPFPRYLYFTFWRPCLKIKDLTNFVINFIFALNDLIFLF